MNNEQVMKIMEELGLHEGGVKNWVPDNAWVKVANAVAAAEREACAKVCDEQAKSIWGVVAEQCAETIRARGASEP